MTRYAYDRLVAGQPLAGLVIAPRELAIGTAIDELELLLACSELDEFRDRVIHLPV